MSTSARTRIASIILIGITLLALSLPTTAGAQRVAPRAKSTFYYLTSKSFAASGWKWSFSLNKGSFGTSLSVNATKTATTGNKPTQRHSWSFSGIAGSDLTTDPTDLLPTSLNTGTDMSVYGKFAGKLKNPSALSKTSSKCKKTGKVLSTTLRRSGTLAGSFIFKPNLTGLPSKVSVPAIGVTITKITLTGNTCSGGGGEGCFPGKSFNGSLTDANSNYASIGASVNKKFASISLLYSENDLTHSVTISHSILGFVPTTAVAFTATGLTIKGGALAPFGSGTLTLTLSNPVTHGTTCVTTSYTVAYASGSITGAFATGDEVYTDPFTFLSATSIKKG